MSANLHCPAPGGLSVGNSAVGEGGGPHMRRGFSQETERACACPPHLSPGTNPSSLVKCAFQSISSSV